MVPGRSVTVSSDAHLHKDFSTYWILLLLLFSHFKIITLSPLAYMFQTISIILYLIFFSPRHHSWRAHFLAGEADSHSLCYFSGDLDFQWELIKAIHLRPSMAKMKVKLSMKDLKTKQSKPLLRFHCHLKSMRNVLIIFFYLRFF